MHRSASPKTSTCFTDCHFQEKSALDHVLHTRSKNLMAASEGHYHELSGWVYQVIQTIKEGSFLLALFALVQIIQHGSMHYNFALLAWIIPWLIWKVCYTGWASWAKLERLQRMLQEEQHEIAHHRDQEKLELRALYEAKGLKSPLLEEVVDVIMADDQRALKVMLEEEMGFVLESHDHPLKMALGVFLGASLLIIPIFIYSLFANSFTYSFFILSGATYMTCSAVIAYYAKNQILRALIWNGAIFSLPLGAIHFLWELFKDVNS